MHDAPAVPEAHASGRRGPLEGRLCVADLPAYALAPLTALAQDTTQLMLVIHVSERRKNAPAAPEADALGRRGPLEGRLGPPPLEGRLGPAPPGGLGA